MTEDREVTAARGRRAQDLLDDDLIKDAFAELERAYMDAWRTTKVDDANGREKLFLAVNIIGKVKQNLLMVAADGKLAAAEIRAMIEGEQRRKRFGIL